MNIDNTNILVFAYLGDTIFENFVRYKLVCDGIPNVNMLQKESLKYVSAKNQASYLFKLMETNFFTDDELDIIKRARNYKGKSRSKSCDVVTYKHATALEAVIGYLRLKGEQNRICELMEQILEGKLC